MAAMFDELGTIVEIGAANATGIVIRKSTQLPLARVVTRIIVNIIATIGTVDNLRVIVVCHLHLAILHALDFDADLPWRRVLLDQVLQILNCSIDHLAVDVFLIKRVQVFCNFE